MRASIWEQVRNFGKEQRKLYLEVTCYYKKTRNVLPNQWPTYYSKAKGCKVWDLDGNEYIDMS